MGSCNFIIIQGDATANPLVWVYLTV